MNVLSRLAELLDLNLDELLGRDSDFEAELAQCLTCLERVTAAARCYVAAVISTEKQIGRELEHAQRSVARCQRRVLEAIARDRPDVVERAMARQHHYEEKACELETENELAQAAMLKAKLLLGKIYDLSADVRQRERVLSAHCRIIANEDRFYRALPQ